MFDFDWDVYLRAYRQKICRPQVNDDFIISHFRQEFDKEILWLDIGNQIIKMVRYIGPDNGRFDAYVFRADLPYIPKRFYPIWVDGLNKITALKYEPGAMLFSFGETNVNSRVTKEMWYAVGKLLASVHGNFFNKFSYVEMEPSLLKSLSLRYLFGSCQEFRNFVIYSFANTVFQNLKIATARRMVSLKDCMIIQEKCEQVLKWLSERHGEILDGLSRFSVLHGDANPENIIICPDLSATLIDWENWYIGDPAMDIAFLFEEMDQSDANGHLDVLRGYYENQTTESLDGQCFFVKRINLYKRIILAKFTVLVANGLCSSDPNMINQPLFDHLFTRLKQEDWREIKCP